MMWIGMTDRYQGLLAELASRSGTHRSRKETAPEPMEGAAASTSSEREPAGNLEWVIPAPATLTDWLLALAFMKAEVERRPDEIAEIAIRVVER